MWTALGIVWAALVLQTTWLLPALDARAALIIAGGTPEGSGLPLHLLYGLAEGLKILALCAAGWLASRAEAPPGANAPRSTSITPRHELTTSTP